MLYENIRLIFWVMLFVILFFRLKKSKVVKKRQATIIIFSVCMMLGLLLHFIPVENLFFSFKSPDKVLNYYKGRSAGYILNGNDSSMIIYSKGNNEFSSVIVPKSEKGYKIPSLFSVRKILPKFGRSGSFDVYHVLGTSDYYVLGIISVNGHESNIIDSNNELVNVITETEFDDSKTMFICSFVENFTNEYYIIVNGEKILVSN